MTENEIKRLIELEQREMAREVIYKYALGLDNNDLNMLRDIFDSDMVFDRPPAEPSRGREEAMVHFESALSRKIDRLKHFITNPVVTSTGENRLLARANIFALALNEGGVNLAFGHYKIAIRVDDEVAMITELGIYLDLPMAPLRGVLGGADPLF